MRKDRNTKQPTNKQTTFCIKRRQLNLFKLILCVSGIAAFISAQPLDHVLMNDGTKRFGTVEVREPSSSDTYLTIDSTLRVELYDVQAYQTRDGYFRKLFTGELLDKHDFTFLKRTTVGKVDLYSSVSWSSQFNPVTGKNTNLEMKISSSQDYVTKSGYHLLEIDYGNLRELLADNTASMRALEEYETLNYYKYGAAGVGALFVLSGASKNINTGKYYFFAGAACFSLAWIPYLLQEAVLRDAVTEYNR